MDFYALSYYHSTCVSAEKLNSKVGGNLISGVENPYLKSSDWGWQIDRGALRYTLNELYGKVIDMKMYSLLKREINSGLSDNYLIGIEF